MGHTCMKVLLPELPRPSVWLLSAPLPKRRSGSVALAKDALQFFSQVRPLAWSKLLNHGRTCLPQPGSRGATEESRRTALLDLRESRSQLFEAATRKAEAMLRETHFAHTPHFPSYARVTLRVSLLSSEQRQKSNLCSRDRALPTARGVEQGHVSRHRSQESAVTFVSRSPPPLTPIGFVKVGENHTSSTNACSFTEPAKKPWYIQQVAFCTAIVL